MAPEISLGYAELSDGRVHYATCGQGHAVLLLHQTPRSWDEYRDVLPLIGSHYRAIAMDTLGFGASSKPTWTPSIERYADVAVRLLDSLGIEKAVVVGHHTGGVIAVDLAARYRSRVDRVVLSSTPLVDANFREMRAGKSYLDEVSTSNDGSHLVQLWKEREPYYPPGRPDLLERLIVDALRAGEQGHLGHAAVANYRMEEALPRVNCPALIIGAPLDPFAYRFVQPLVASISASSAVEIPDGYVPLPDQLPDPFASAVLEFITPGSTI
jgi:pimeloyl-ACP methyl ester carboxylesterase